jgi:predicted  nucleic acid-binding Zn-ribbon protein
MAWLSAKTLEDLSRLSKLLTELDHMKAEQVALSRAMVALGERIARLETAADAADRVAAAREETLKAQVEAIALREVQASVNAVQGEFFRRLEALRLDVDRASRPALPGA